MIENVGSLLFKDRRLILALPLYRVIIKKSLPSPYKLGE